MHGFGAEVEGAILPSTVTNRAHPDAGGSTDQAVAVNHAIATIRVACAGRTGVAS